MVSSYVRKTIGFASEKRGISGLTNRGIEIAKLFPVGFTNQKTAEQLNISHRTYDTHRTNIMQKVKVENVAELVKYYIMNKLIEV